MKQTEKTTEEAPKTRIKIGTSKQPVRFSYAHVFEPHAMEEGKDKKYSVTVLIPKAYESMIEIIEDAIEAAAKIGDAKFWGGKRPTFKSGGLRDGDVEYPDKPEYEGMYFINATSSTKPQVVDEFLDPILPETVNGFYSGCWGRISVNFYPFDKKVNRGVACGLNNIQKTKDDDAFTGGSTAEQDFGSDD